MIAKRKNLMRLVVLVSMSAALYLFPTISEAGGSHEITLAMNSWIGYAPLFVASKMKYYGDYEVKYIHMDSGINAAVISGDVDIADLSMNQVILDNVKGEKIKIFFPIDYSNGADAIVAKNEITKISSLRGLTIPLNTASYSELLLSYALSKDGMTLDEVKMVDTPASAVPAVLLGGHALAGVTWAPHVSVVTKHPGYHVLFSSREAPGLITDNMCAQTDWIKKNPAAAMALISGMIKGEKYIKQHPKRAFFIISKYMGITPKQAEQQYAGVVNPNIKEMYYMMTKDKIPGFISYDQSVSLVDGLMKKTGKLSSRVKVSSADMLFEEYVRRVYDESE
ncbi:ABC transporter substrate-binding protein [Acidithiobacillus sp. IBUN Pt1247-S3]|uniref:ABC transporter substrate-binding protein n=1 Tax=Acidithiobacillus sp. IBUN Pt1247-S3 TaxID=3166642 RepID=UPI0034E5E5A3